MKRYKDSLLAINQKLEIIAFSIKLKKLYPIEHSVADMSTEATRGFSTCSQLYLVNYVSLVETER